MYVCVCVLQRSNTNITPRIPSYPLAEMTAITFLLWGFVVIFSLHSRTFSVYQNEYMFYILFVTYLFALSISCNKLLKKELLYNLPVLRATLFNIKVLRHWLQGTLGGQNSIASLSSSDSLHLPGWLAANDILRGRASFGFFDYSRSSLGVPLKMVPMERSSCEFANLKECGIV